jgi:hypothetical protein
VADAALLPALCGAAEQNFGANESTFRIRATSADNGCDFHPLRGFHSPLFDVRHVTDSSVYDLASALNGRRLGRMTPRS